jgi:anti-anti-sigma factor
MVGCQHHAHPDLWGAQRSGVRMLNTPDFPVPFDVALEPRRERLVAVVRGELDIASAERLQATVLEQFENGFDHVVADLRHVPFIDSSGIRVLWQVHRRAERDGVRLSVIPGNGDVSRALRMTGLLDHMHLLER